MHLVTQKSNLQKKNSSTTSTGFFQPSPKLIHQDLSFNHPVIILQRKCTDNYHNEECKEEKERIQTLQKKQNYFFQPKSVVGSPDDEYEREADEVAEKVMRMPETSDYRKSACSSCDYVQEERGNQDKLLVKKITPLVQRQEIEEEEEIIQTRRNGNKSFVVPAEVEENLQNIKGRGQPLDRTSRAYFEPRFGIDFGNVHLHTNTDASETAKLINAKAFTIGQDIIFAKGQYEAGTKAGKKLLAHELTHVVQQNKKMIPNNFNRRKRNVSNVYNLFEDQIQRKAVSKVVPQKNMPSCSSATKIQINKETFVEIGPIEQPARNCSFTPLFHINASSVKIKVHAKSPPQGDWRIDVYECPQKFAIGAQCDRYSRKDSIAGSISTDLEIHYEQILWVTRDIFIRIRNGSMNPIPSVIIKLTPIHDSYSGIIHGALDALGLLPFLGVIPDAINAGFYLIEGDFIGAGISAAAMVPIFGQGAGITRLGIKVSKESIERLGREGVERAIREGVEKAGTRVLRKAPSGRIVSALRKFTSRTFKSGSETFILDYKGMKHILERHHPRYWNGEIKTTQSFLEESLSIDDVTKGILDIMSQNRNILIKKGVRGQYQIMGKWGGRKYIVGLNNGRVGQFFPF